MAALAAILAASVVALTPGSTWQGPATSVPGASAAPDPLTPAVAKIAWREPRQRIETIVRFQPGVDAAQARDMIRGREARVTGEVGLINALAVESRAGEAARIARLPGVHAVSLNAKVATDNVDIDADRLQTSFNQSVRSPKVWESGSFPATGKGVGVAVIDTGVQGDLPDFQVSASDTTSRVIASATTHPEPDGHGDGFGHGTHVAGIIAGNGTLRGDHLKGKYAGVAPEANLISVKVSNDAGEATVLDVIYGLQFVIEHKDEYGIRIANLSLNSTVAESYRTDPLDAAVEEAWFSGIVVVAAAGNRGSEPDAVQYAPGNDPYVVSVGAVNDMGTKPVEDDTLAEWSSRGTTQDGYSKPEVLAPGAHITSNLSPGSEISRLCAECVRNGGGYFQMGGTSMAAAVASGVAALLLEEHPDWTPDEVKGAMENRLRNVPGYGGETAVDKAITAPDPKLAANEGLTPNDYIDPATNAIDWERARWSRARWSDKIDPERARWSRARWSLHPETVAETATETTDAEVEEDRARWSRARWSRARWSMSFDK